MAMDCVPGCYECVKDESFVQFLCKMGMPKEDAEKMNGTHWKMRLEKCDDRWVGMICCEECSEMNNLDSFTEGVDKEIDHPLFGGKATLKFCRDGDNSFKCSAKTENCGTLEWHEKYTEEGAEICMKHVESGATHKEKWCRKVKMLGWFECCKMEGVEEYMKKAKTPDYVDANKTMRVCFAKDGDRVVLTETFGKDCIVTRMRMDEEITYAPGTPLEGKLLLTKLGPHNFKFIYCTNRGEEHWDLKFSSKGMCYVGCHKPTGATCKMYFKPCVNIFGKWKPVCIHNFTQFGVALGIPADICSKMANENTARLEYIDEGDGFVRCKVTSKYIPMDVTAKWNEEFEHCLTMGGVTQKYKCLVTKEGDTIIDIWKNDKFTVCTTVKFTGCWAIFSNKICGTDICSKYVYERC